MFPARLAQLARASARHAEGRAFESRSAQLSIPLMGFQNRFSASAATTAASVSPCRPVQKWLDALCGTLNLVAFFAKHNALSKLAVTASLRPRPDSMADFRGPAEMMQFQRPFRAADATRLVGEVRRPSLRNPLTRVFTLKLLRPHRHIRTLLQRADLSIRKFRNQVKCEPKKIS